MADTTFEEMVLRMLEQDKLEFDAWNKDVQLYLSDLVERDIDMKEF